MIVQSVSPLRINEHSSFHFMTSISGLKFSSFSDSPLTDSILKYYKRIFYSLI